MRKNFFILGLLASFLLIGLSAKATDGLTISVDNSRKMLSDGSAIISWNVNIEPEYCGIDYSPNSDLSGGIGTNGALVQAGLATNDGKFYYVVNLNNLDSNKDYYYKVICTLKGDNLVYKSEIKKLSKYEVTPASTITVSKTGTGSGTVFEGTFLEMGSVINCGNKCSASFMSGASAITLTASPASGSVFTSWTGCGSNTTNPVCIVQIGSSTHNIIANFTTTTISPARTITVSKTGTGSGTVFEGTFLEMGSVINCGDKCSASFMTNTSAITLTASPATGSVFTSWQGCGSNTTNPVCVVQIGSSTSNVIANFSTQQVVPANDFKVTKIGTGSGTVFEGTFLESGSVINCGDKCSASFMTSASAITLTAIPDQNSKFMGWFGNCDSGINDPSKTTCIVTPNKAKTVIAAFSTNPVTNLPRIMYWSGKVNQHWNISSSKWETDSDGLSGAGLDKLNYCKKYYPQTVSISPFKEEVTSSWKDGGNVGAYTSVKQSYLCVQGNGTSTPFIYPATAKTDSVSVLTTPKTTNSTNSAVSNITTVNSTTASSADDSIILKLQRKITELETKVIELEKRATQLDQKFANKYAGTMFLDVENQGRLWYVDPASKNRFYFENGESALSIGSKLATGISYDNIQKIPIGIPDKLYSLQDSDSDGLPDKLESALGLNSSKADTDGDTISDKQEILNGYNPLGSQKYNYDQALANKLEGKMLLQVSGPNSHGEIWYIHNGKRWYGGTQDSMYEIMKSMSLGAIPENIRKIEVGGVSGVE